MNRPRLSLFLVITFGAMSLVLLAVLIIKGVQQPQNATKSEAVGTTTDPAKCQGNANAVAKCFDCKKDSGTQSEVNILDFACFKNVYGKTVGK